MLISLGYHLVNTAGMDVSWKNDSMSWFVASNPNLFGLSWLLDVIIRAAVIEGLEYMHTLHKSPGKPISEFSPHTQESKNRQF